VKLAGQILDIDYSVEDEEPVVRIYGKTSDEETFVAEDRNFRPYFYAVPVDDEALQQIQESSFEHDGEELPVTEAREVDRRMGNQEETVIQVFTGIPTNVSKLRKEVEGLEKVRECREFDIPFYKRYLIDNQVSPVKGVEIDGEEFDSKDFDVGIEVDSIEEKELDSEIEYYTTAFDLEIYQDQVIMAALYTEEDRKVLTSAEIDREFVETVEDEKELLERLFEELRKADIITGYNTDEFDFKRLRERAQHHGMEVNLGRDGERVKFKRRGRFSAARVKGRAHLDLYPFVSHVLSQGLDSETLDLDSVAQELLGREKDDVSWSRMKEMWSQKENLEEFADYCLKDAELAFELSEELVPQVLELSRITGLTPFDADRLTYGQLTENYLLKEARKRNILSPNRPSRSEQRRRSNQGAYEGGFVYTPESGIHENIALFDFRSLYPTVMVAHNISPDTLEVEGCSEEYEIEELGYSFCQDFQGFLPELVESLVKERYELKKKLDDYEEGSRDYNSIYSRQEAEKILANSFYGYMGYNGARWYSRESAEATTFLGRKYIEDTIETAEEMGFEVVYGDTDSVFLKKEGIRQDIDDFLDEVNDHLPEFMELEYEGFYETGLFTSTESGEGAKKKYALMSEDGFVKITGFEQVRRDWSPIAKQTQEEVIHRVLTGNIDGAVEYVENIIEELQEGEVDVEDLKIYTTLTKDPEEYDATSPHVSAARKAKKRGETVEEGTTIAYVITSGGGSISERSEMLKFADSYDSGYYIDNQVVPVAHRVLKVFGYTQDQLKGKGKQSGLDQFG
jgi:DNA polymerase elongation subunit (family B)